MKRYIKNLFRRNVEPQDPATKSREKEYWKNHDQTLGKKMSRGAANIFRIIKTRCGWGNKDLWNKKKEKNHHHK